MVLGLRIVEELATETLITADLMVSKRANVSFKTTNMQLYFLFRTDSDYFYFLFSPMPAYKHQQSPRLQQCPHITPAAVTMTVSYVCPKCGTIEKSGKISCCGRGGAWYGNCGSAGNKTLATRGTRASRPAKHGGSNSRQSLPNSQPLLNT